MSWVVVQEVISGTGNSLFTGLDRELRNVRLAALNLEGISGWIWVSQARTGVSENLGFSLFSP